MSASALARKGMLADPGDHFAGRFEVERKFAIDDRAALQMRLEAAGAVPFALGNRETDTFYDWPDGRLASLGKQQVLRLMEPSHRVLWFVKGPDADECVAMDLEDIDRAHAMFAALGLVEAGRVAKSRDIYFLGDFHVTLDRVPRLGDFAEIAVMADDRASISAWGNRIEALAADLELPARGVRTRSYRAMLADMDGPR